MDALIETSDQLSMVFNWLCGSNIVIQSFFILIVMTKTPREMTTLRYTLMNTVSWSLLIVIQFGVVVRPVAFLPLPVCLITGFFFVNSLFVGITKDGCLRSSQVVRHFLGRPFPSVDWVDLTYQQKHSISSLFIEPFLCRTLSCLFPKIELERRSFYFYRCSPGHFSFSNCMCLCFWTVCSHISGYYGNNLYN